MRKKDIKSMENTTMKEPSDLRTLSVPKEAVEEFEKTLDEYIESYKCALGEHLRRRAQRHDRKNIEGMGEP